IFEMRDGLPVLNGRRTTPAELGRVLRKLRRENPALDRPLVRFLAAGTAQRPDGPGSSLLEQFAQATHQPVVGTNTVVWISSPESTQLRAGMPYATTP